MNNFNKDNINTQEFISKLTSTLHNNGQTAINSLIIATATFGSIDKIGLVSKEKWIKNVSKYISKAVVRVNDQEHQANVDDWFGTLVHAQLLSEDGEVGSKLVDMVLTTEIASPASMEHGVTRRHPIVPFHNKYKLASRVSPLLDKAIDVLQSTAYTVDEYMLSLVQAVQASLLLNNIVMDDKYVIDGCVELVKYDNIPRVSEFKTDSRIRIYQSDNHGPSGQSSDLARSLMNLHGVHTNYNIKKAILAVRGEMEDMITCASLDDAIDNLRDTDSLVNWVSSQIIYKEHDKADTLPIELASNYMVSKPWSFVKANKILTSLEKGERPYIGMAFGLDAKCSGPQYGAIMTGDIKLAKACGFSMEKSDLDAYEIAIKHCKAAGVHGLTRSLIKKPYMGVFYGQGFGAFSELNNYGSKPGQHSPRLLPVIQSIKAQPEGFESLLDAQAKVFHKAIESSFGNMSALRNEIKGAHYHYEDFGGTSVKVMDTTKPTMHRMPDSCYIAMSYKVKTTITGDVVSYDTEVPDVVVDVPSVVNLTFKKMTFKTKDYNLEDFARSGFVNLIQGVDAYIARHIIAAMGELDALHTISVHDCFRTNINDFLDGKLHNAIKIAYKRVFVEMGTNGDILKDYFQGVRDAGGVFPKSSIAYMLDDGELKMADWLDIEEIIDDLENKLEGKEGAYYFAK